MDECTTPCLIIHTYNTRGSEYFHPSLVVNVWPLLDCGFPLIVILHLSCRSPLTGHIRVRYLYLEEEPCQTLPNPSSLHPIPPITLFLYTSFSVVPVYQTTSFRCHPIDQVRGFLLKPFASSWSVPRNRQIWQGRSLAFIAPDLLQMWQELMLFDGCVLFLRG